MLAVLIFVGAGIGGVARFALSSAIQGSTDAAFPWATLAINVSGSMLLGFVYGLLEGLPAAPEWRAFLGVGILGGYTTFSTFSWESLRMLQDGEWARVMAYATGSVVLSLGATLIGFRLASMMLARG